MLEAAPFAVMGMEAILVGENVIEMAVLADAHSAVKLKKVG